MTNWKKSRDTCKDDVRQRRQLMLEAKNVPTYFLSNSITNSIRCIGQPYMYVYRRACVPYGEDLEKEAG